MFHQKEAAAFHVLFSGIYESRFRFLYVSYEGGLYVHGRSCTCLNDWPGACRAQCCGRTCQFLGPRSRPWRRDAPPGWPPSNGGHQICAPGSCHSAARWGSEPEGCPEQMCLPGTRGEKELIGIMNMPVQIRAATFMSTSFLFTRHSLQAWGEFIQLFNGICMCWPAEQNMKGEHRGRFIQRFCLKQEEWQTPDKCINSSLWDAFNVVRFCWLML